MPLLLAATPALRGVCGHPVGRGLGLRAYAIARGVDGRRRVAWEIDERRRRRSLSTQTIRGGLTAEEMGLSTARGVTEPHLLRYTIPQHFAETVSAHGDRTAVISRSQKERLTYRSLDERSNALALGLRERGVGKGDRVAVSLGNSWEFAVTTYALFKLGAILVPLNPAFNAPQIISALSHLEAAHLVIGAETNLPFKPPRENLTLLNQICPDLTASKVESEVIPSLRNIILVDNSSSRVDVAPLLTTTPFMDLFSSSFSSLKITPDSPLHPDETVNIQFTSGTTSMPKAAMLSHHSILNNGFFIGNRMGLTPSDVVCCPPPLFHCFGCILGYMATATHGSAIVFPSEAFNPEATLRAVQEEGATALYGVATMFVAELELLANGTVPYMGFDKLRTGIAAGSSVPKHLMEKLHKTLNLTGLTICYGMTETSPVSCMTTPDDPLEKRLGSVGRLLPHVEARIVDVDDPSKILPLGARGELVVSGYLVMKGYWGDAAKTAAVRTLEPVLDPTTGRPTGEHKVWMRTGDEAEMDAQGYVSITGRIKDLIIRGGENIHPLEVENALFAHPAIREASVVGLPDDRYGECVAAFVIPRDGVDLGVDDGGVGDAAIDEFGQENESPSNTASNSEQASKEPRQILTKHMVRTWVRAQLSNHLAPKHVFWATEYPKTASGKIQKFKLVERGVELLKQEKKG